MKIKKKFNIFKSAELRFRFFFALFAVIIVGVGAGYFFAVSASGIKAPVPSGWGNTTKTMRTFESVPGWPAVDHFEKNGILLTVRSLKRWGLPKTSGLGVATESCKNKNGEFVSKTNFSITPDGDNYFWTATTLTKGTPTDYDLAKCDEGTWKIGDAGTYKYYDYAWNKLLDKGAPQNLYAISQYMLWGPYNTPAEKTAFDNASKEMGNYFNTNKEAISKVVGETGTLDASSKSSDTGVTFSGDYGLNGSMITINPEVAGAKVDHTATVGVPYTGDDPSKPVPASGQQTDFWGYVRIIIDFSLKFGGALAGLVIIYAGILYMTSKGESGKLQSAKEYFLGALIGMSILILIGPLLDALGLPNRTL